jgi:hypothetical protein
MRFTHTPDLLQKFGVKELRDFYKLTHCFYTALHFIHTFSWAHPLLTERFLPPIPKSFTFINVILIEVCNAKTYELFMSTNVYKRFDPRVMESEERIGINCGLPKMCIALPARVLFAIKIIIYEWCLQAIWPTVDGERVTYRNQRWVTNDEQYNRTQHYKTYIHEQPIRNWTR